MPHKTDELVHRHSHFTVRHMVWFVFVSFFDIVSLAQLNVLSVLLGEEENFLVKVCFRKFFLFKKLVMEITSCSICLGSFNGWLHFWGTLSEESVQ